MHFGPVKKSLFWLISIVIFVGFVTFLNLLDSGTYKLDSQSQKLVEKVKVENRINLDVQLLQFDSASQSLKARVWIKPPENYATYLDSSVQVKYDTSVDISAASIDYNDENNLGFWSKDQYLRAIDLELDADNGLIASRDSDKWFPFDR